MNRLYCFITLLFLLVSSFSYSQEGYLFVKKGIKKKRTYVEGDPIAIRFADGTYMAGTITLLRNDTVFISGLAVPRSDIKEVVLPKKARPHLPDVKTLLLIGAGSALVTAGLTLSKQAEFKKALEAGLVIGYAPILIKYLGAKFFHAMTRKKFRIGKKYRLQVLDFHLSPGRKAF
jgi:hypothetical protein